MKKNGADKVDDEFVITVGKLEIVQAHYEILLYWALIWCLNYVGPILIIFLFVYI